MDCLLSSSPELLQCSRFPNIRFENFLSLKVLNFEQMFHFSSFLPPSLSRMALFLSAKLLVDTLAMLPATALNSSFSEDSSPSWINAPEILEFKFTPNPAIEGQNVNVTCVVRPANSQVLITRIRTDDLDHSQDYTESFANDTISIYGADQSGVLWGNVPYNKSGEINKKINFNI
jgi:hypothetical protein